MSVERSRTRRGTVTREALELWGGIALVIGGFVAVALGWSKAAGTADIRVQLQALISGGLGGLAAVVAGAFAVQTYVTDSGLRRLERQLDRVTGALLELVGVSAEQVLDDKGVWGPGADVRTMRVLASHAAFHLPSCDLVDGRNDLRTLTYQQAGDEELTACRVCIKEPVG